MRAPSVGRQNSTRVDEGRKSRNLLAIKMQGTNRSGVTGGGKAPAMWPRIWGTARRQRKRRAKIINGMAKIYLEYVYIFEFVQWPWYCASTLITDKHTQIEETKGKQNVLSRVPSGSSVQYQKYTYFEVWRESYQLHTRYSSILGCSRYIKLCWVGLGWNMYKLRRINIIWQPTNPIKTQGHNPTHENSEKKC